MVVLIINAGCVAVKGSPKSFCYVSVCLYMFLCLPSVKLRITSALQTLLLLNLYFLFLSILLPWDMPAMRCCRYLLLWKKSYFLAIVMNQTRCSRFHTQKSPVLTLKREPSTGIGQWLKVQHERVLKCLFPIEIWSCFLSLALVESQKNEFNMHLW